ncbi:MAG: hypothetical protein ACLTKT_03210 [Clostridia bacterium]
MKQLWKAILKVMVLMILFIVLNFILDLVINMLPWIKPLLLILAIIGLVAYYYFDYKDNK